MEIAIINISTSPEPIFEVVEKFKSKLSSKFKQPVGSPVEIFNHKHKTGKMKPSERKIVLTKLKIQNIRSNLQKHR